MKNAVDGASWGHHRHVGNGTNATGISCGVSCREHETGAKPGVLVAGAGRKFNPAGNLKDDTAVDLIRHKLALKELVFQLHAQQD